MIRYDYICRDCKSEFEIQRKSYKDKKKAKCPNCNSSKVRKIIGVPSIQFIGEGFTLNKSE